MIWMTRQMPIMEIFGPTIQGEGQMIGQKTIFVRTGGCDYNCSWCDSAFTWNGSEKAHMMSADAVYMRIKELAETQTDNGPVLNTNHVTISGGNPALIGDPLGRLISLLQMDGIRVGVETQGSRFQNWFLDLDDLTISPKPPSSGMTTDFGMLSYIITEILHRVNFSLKVVVFDETDLEYAKQLHRQYRAIPFYLSVGNINAYEDGNISDRLLDKLNWLWQKVIQDPELNDVKAFPQLHTLVWSNARSV